MSPKSNKIIYFAGLEIQTLYFNMCCIVLHAMKGSQSSSYGQMYPRPGIEIKFGQKVQFHRVDSLEKYS